MDINTKSAFFAHQPVSLQFGPILITLTVIIGFWSWYFSAVDSQWLLNNMLHIQVLIDDLNTEEKNLLRNMLTIDFIRFSTFLGAIGSLIVSLILLSAYIVLVSRYFLPKGQEVNFTTAINVSSTASLVTAGLHVLYAVYVFLVQESKVNLYEVDFLSLNNSLLGWPPEHPLFNFANSISIATLLFVGCCSYLITKKSSFTIVQAILIYLFPYCVLWSLLLANFVF